MKKKIYLIVPFILALLIMMPLTVEALDPDVEVTTRLNCTTSVKKQGKVTCDIYADINGGAVDAISGTVEADQNYFENTVTSINYNAGYQAGNNIHLGTISFTAKTNAGIGRVVLKDLVATAGSNTAVVNPDTTNCQITVLNNDSTLKNIKIDNKLISGFSASKYTYSVNSEAKQINISAETTDQAGKVSGTGKKNLACGKNNITLKATAEDGTTTDYKITVNKTCDESTKLKGIKISAGALSPSFKSDIYSYTITVSTEVDKIQLTGEKENDKQTIAGNGTKTLKYGDNRATIKVKAENGDEQSYNFTIIREDGRSKNNYLTSISLSNGSILFDRETLEYNLRVLYETNSIEVNAIPEDTKAKIKITGGEKLAVGNNKIEIKVTAENEEEKTYIINVEKLQQGETLGNNPDVAGISVTGYELGYTLGKNNYTLKIKDEESLNIIVTMQESTSNYQIIGNENLKNGSVITIRTQSADGTTNSYEITIEKDDNMMLIIAVALIVVIAIAIVVYIIVKSQKNKKDSLNSLKDNQVKTTVLSDDALLNKVEGQLKEADNKKEKVINNLNKEDIIKPISIINPLKSPTEKSQPKAPIKQATDNKIKNPIKPLTREEIMSKMPLPKTEAKQTSPLKVKQESQQEPSNVQEETKICSICGHRVPESAKICPYCRRMW